MSERYLVTLRSGWTGGADRTLHVGGVGYRFNRHQTDSKASDYPEHVIPLTDEQLAGLRAYGLEGHPLTIHQELLRSSDGQLSRRAFVLRLDPALYTTHDGQLASRAKTIAAIKRAESKASKAETTPTDEE
jgi:hypothetical protein